MTFQGMLSVLNAICVTTRPHPPPTPMKVIKKKSAK